MSARLTECPHCGSKSYTAYEPPYASNRLYGCRRCGRTFRQLDARRKAQGWTESEIYMGFKKSTFKDLFKK